MKIGLFNPYMDSFGGGERYMLTLASHWSKNHTVHVFWDDETVLKASEKRFGLDLSNVTAVPNVFAAKQLVKKMLVSATYDLIIFLTDGSVPTSLAKHNILHVQVPFSHMKMHPWKSSRYQYIVCNSEFTKDNLDSSLSIPRVVIYPPVDVDSAKKVKKENIILSVGRFNGHHNVKKQDVLIEAFKEGVKKKLFSNWKLILAGSLLPSDQKFLSGLEELSKGLNIEFKTNISFEEMQRLYGKASIYWHAAGFKETKPEYMEHFGISTVEAMAQGCTVVVYNGGGQKEIVTDGVNGFTWETQEELLKKTVLAMKAPEKLVKKAQLRSKDFSKETFTSAFDSLLTKL